MKDNVLSGVMLNYFYRPCQYIKMNFLIILMALITVWGCSNIGHEVDISVQVDKHSPFWFVVPERFSFKDSEEKAIFHPFFDADPFENIGQGPEVDSEKDVIVVLPPKEPNLVKFYVLTPENSEFSYDFNLLSGKRILKHRYCKVGDVWKSYGRDIYRPPFTEGIIPRIIDETGNAQKIIVFGGKKKISRKF